MAFWEHRNTAILSLVILLLLKYHLVNTQTNIDCIHGDIRLIGGCNQYEGRVEICYNGEWGTVCQSRRDNTDAWPSVVCKQLGYSERGSLAIGNSAFGQGTGNIWLGSVNCVGSEGRLIECTYGSGISCIHRHDVGVVCQIPSTASSSGCTQGDIRLVGGTTDYDGRVEVCINDCNWVSVCSELWDNQDATVVCRQLVHNYTGAMAVSLGYSTLAYSTMYYEVRCVGNEGRLIDCPATAIYGNRDCVPAGVLCQRQLSDRPCQCTEGNIRLVGESTSHYGLVELCTNCIWTRVCDDGWGFEDATVVCRQLGFSDARAIAIRQDQFGLDTGYVLTHSMNCNGTEGRLTDCPTSRFTGSRCDFNDVAGVVCQAPFTSGCMCTQGDIRLMGGATLFEGRVEVCINCVWVSVCHDNWDNQDATVVCRQLGLNVTGAIVVWYSGFGPSSFDPRISSIQCTGSEDELIQCASTTVVTSILCESRYEAGVVCQAPCTSGCTNGAVRLAEGTTNFEGRVELCVNCVWISICGSNWGNQDTSVVCRELGYPDIQSTIAYTQSFSSHGSEHTDWLLQINCQGTEDRLIDCPATGIGSTYDCSQHVGVRCRAPCTVGCTQGDIRLVEGSNDTNGRVEVCSSCVWARMTVCSGGVTSNDANVICRQLGYNGTGMVLNSQHINFYGGYVWLGNERCDGNEERLSDCPTPAYYNIESYSCSHSGVACQAQNTNLSSCIEGDIRLVGGNSEYEGRVELCIIGSWHTVCDDGWDNQDANVVCRQLGHSSAGSLAFPNATFGQGIGDIGLTFVYCVGNEQRLTDCPATTNKTLINRYCGHINDAGVVCRSPSSANISCTEGDVRLVGGSEEFEGRVEMCMNSVWITVCENYWGSQDANVVCQQLGYDTGAIALSHVGYSSNNLIGYRQLSLYVHCSGNEDRLIECGSMTTRLSSCNRHAGVRCQASCTLGCTEGDIRLVGGTAQLHEGYLELCVNCVWVSVCRDNFDNKDASVACRQLGYNNTGAIAVYYYNDHGGFHQGTGYIWLNHLSCVGSEERIVDCPTTAVSNYDCNLARVLCPTFNTVDCTQGDVRLVGGATNHDGQVELCINDAWTTVCDHGNSWNRPDANVVCRQLGYNVTGVTPISRAGFDYHRSIGYKIYGVYCSGNEESLLECRTQYAIGISHGCYRAGVICQPSCTSGCREGDIRLVGGTTHYEGRVELCANCEWGTICHSIWSDTDASVVCRQLRFNDTGAISTHYATFGPGTGYIWLNKVDCSGSETRLIDCPSGEIGWHHCHHRLDAGVRCQPLQHPSAPTNVMTTSQSNSITITWTQPQNDIVDRYEITYSYQGPCSNITQSENGTLDDDSRRTFTLGELHEHSNYIITITAANSAGANHPVTRTVTTLPAAISGRPQLLTATSAQNPTNINIQWDEVECIKQNSEITGYLVRYGGVVHIVSETSTGTFNFTATGLIPRTSYTFEVAAVSNTGTGPFATATVETAAPESIGLLHNGQFYSNNSIMTLDAIGEDSTSVALLCLTNKTDCCSTIGNWFFPNDVIVPSSSFGSNFYTNRGPSAVSLHRRNNTQTTGVFRCEIDDASGTIQQLYIGVYNQNSGFPIVSVEIVFDQSTLTLTCTSTGGPATTVTWMKNGVVVEVDDTNYQESQRVLNTEMATYENILTTNVADNVLGNFNCCVINVRGSSCRNVTINGIITNITTSGSTIAGGIYTLQCDISTSIPGLANTPTATWFGPNGTPVTSGASITITSTTAATSILRFNSLTTSQAGSYTCEGSIESPALESPQIVGKIEEVEVQITTFSVMVDVPNGTLYAGTSVAVMCTITVDDAVDTDVEVDVIWNPARDRLNVQTTTGSRPSFISTAIVSPLSYADTGFTCSAVIRPLSGSNFITASGPQNDTGNVIVQIPPLPSVDVTTVGLSIIGDPYKLICRVTVVENLIQPPTVLLTGPGVGQTEVVITGPNVSGPVTTLTLSFSPLHASHAGRYTCRAILDIPNADISQPTNSDSQNIDVLDPLFQLRLTGISNCQTWRADRPAAKSADIATAVHTNIARRCQCNFTIGAGGFQCIQDSVIYRAEVHASSQVTVSEVIIAIENWITHGAGIFVQSLFTNIDSNCGVLVRNFNDECPPQLGAELPSNMSTVPIDITTEATAELSTESSTETPSGTTGRSPQSVADNLFAIVGGAGAVVIAVIILVVAIIAITALVMWNRKAVLSVQKNNPRGRCDPVPAAAVLNSISPTGDYEMQQDDYEDLEQYNCAYVGMNSPKGRQASSDYEYMQCPTYTYIPSKQNMSTPVNTSSGDQNNLDGQSSRKGGEELK